MLSSSSSPGEAQQDTEPEDEDAKFLCWPLVEQSSMVDFEEWLVHSPKPNIEGMDWIVQFVEKEKTVHIRHFSSEQAGLESGDMFD